MRSVILTLAMLTAQNQNLPLAPVHGALNPAVRQSTIATTICVRGWTATIRPPESYTHDIKLQLVRAAHGKMGDYELDHFIPLELGGAPYDRRNLWLEPHAGKWGSYVKDRLENRLHDLVCAHQLSLAKAREEIRTNWIAAYRQQFGDK